MSDRAGWVKWLQSYGAGKFFDAFMSNAQGAKSVCVHCAQDIFLDIAEGGGVPDWKTADGDYGCAMSPETSSEGTGSHFPERL